MKHLQLFESHNKNERIKEELENYYLTLLDQDYRASFSHNLNYGITVFNLYKNRIDFDFPKVWSEPNWQKELKSVTMELMSIQKRLLNLEIEHIHSKVQFHVYTYYRYPEVKSTLEPGLIEYSSILNGDVIWRDLRKKLDELKMDCDDLKAGMIKQPLKFYYDIQIQQDIDYGFNDATSVLFKNTF